MVFIFYKFIVSDALLNTLPGVSGITGIVLLISFFIHEKISVTPATLIYIFINWNYFFTSFTTVVAVCLLSA